MQPDPTPERRRAHCWESTTSGMLGGGTCLLWEDHEGPHEFIPDDEFTVSFAPRAEADR